MTYSDKLKDPRWQRVRLSVFARDEWKCLACNRADQTLHVNHLEYNGEPWEARMEMLETLCEDCHAIREYFNKYTLAAMRRTSSVRMVPFQLAVDKLVELLPGQKMSSLLVDAMNEKIKKLEAGE